MESYNLQKVELQADVYMACLQHALSTENYEVMGLLIGNLSRGVAEISAMIVLRRLDKKKDRVEISAEQLLRAAEEAERLASVLNRPMAVLGWYHSHPHITVCPSHVDVGTQATYQLMEPGFVGLIFSVFSEGKDTKEQEVYLTCFQSRNNEAIEIPIEIVRTDEISNRCLDTMIEVPKILTEEEETTAAWCGENTSLLAIITSEAVKTRQFAHIANIMTRPLVQTLELRISTNEKRAQQIREELRILEKNHL